MASATSVLIDSLQGSGAELTLVAAAALQHLVSTPKGRAEIIAGGIAPCLKVLAQQGGAEETILHMLAILQQLVVESKGRLAVGGANAAYPLVKLATCAGSTGKTKEAAAVILCSLAQEKSELPALVSAGAAAPLTALLRDGATAAQEAAAFAIRQLTTVQTRFAAGPAAPRKGTLVEVALVEAGVLAPLAALLWHGSAAVQVHGLHVLFNLASCHDSQQALGADRDAVTACVQRLNRVRRPSAAAAAAAPSPEQQAEITEIEKLAAGTLAALAAAGARAAVVAAGGVEALVGQLISPRPEVAMLSARALSSLSEDAVSHIPLAASALVPLIELVGKGGAAGKVAMVTLNRMAAGGKMEVLTLTRTQTRTRTRTLTLTQVLDALARSPAAIGAYVHELKGSREEQVVTMTALKHLAGVPMARQSIVDADGLGGLVEVAKSKSMDQGAKDAAALVLAALAAPPHTEQVAASGGVAALISVVAGTSQPELTLSAACALEYLVTTEAARAALLRGGVAPVLELLLHNKVEQVQLHALRVMQALADDEEGQQAINAAGAAFWLSRLAYSGDAGIREAVSGTLCSLATQAS